MSQKKQNQLSRSRKWQITINNPQDKGFTHEKLKTMFKSFPSLIYWCMADEIGLENNQYHTHAYVCLKNPMRFETLQNRFNKQAHLENAVGTSKENRDYIFKQGKWANSPKADTQVEGTQEEGGRLPDEAPIKIDDTNT